ncbi:hypothetical protein HYC85_022364 [Camellia sinensis]|uniref:Ribosomal RNA-processing protein 12-like conserved domain-containing protein n=1 Tax=Camellia sinensis TaxID=4442 RepID=A0A7J7GL37_CAMSI|nr:hypothetical protein HYC85_022364 [Camellia sinensis]
MNKPHKTTTQDSIHHHHDRRRHHHHHERRRRSNHQDHQEPTDTGFTDASDLCQQLLDRYGKSSAPQHRYLCATASATRSIIESESLPLTPLSYFAAAISTVAASDTTSLDSNAVSALSSFLAIVLPLLPKDSIVASKAGDAVGVLVELVDRPGEELATASARSLVKCLGVLLGFCDLEDWDSVKVGFGTLLKFSIDRRPKVRKCAQDCVVKVFKSFESSTVIEASKLVLSSLKGYMPLAVEINASAVIDGSKDEISKPEHLEVIHMLTLLKHIVPYLSVKVSLKVLQQLHKLMNSHFTALTRHIFSVIEAIFETSKAEVVILQAENIIKSLTSYVNMGVKNPNDTLLSAATLLKSALDKLQTGEVSKWINNLPLVFDSIAGLLTSEASTASQASNTLKELINFHIRSNCLTIDNESVDDEVKHSMESSAVKSTCAIFENVLSSCGGVPNEQSLAVISALFCKLGEISHFYMKGTIIKLADIMTLACRNKSDTKHLQECIGSAVIAIGPEKILALLPINPNAEDPSCSNVWLIPILRNYAVGSSLGFFMEHVVPLAESFQRVCAKVKKSMIQEELQAYARGCWGLLPAFCRHPTDTHQNFGSLVKLLVTFITKDSFMLENIAIALQELVNQNKTVVRSNEGTGEFATLPKTSEINGSSVVFKSKPPYSKKIASRNIRALASCARELVQALVDVFFDSPPEKRAYLKDAIGCLASITDSSVTKSIFISSLERFQLINDLGEFGKQGSHISASADQEQGNITPSEKGTKRCLTVELASSLVEGASEDMIALIFGLIKHTLQESDEVGQTEAYHTLSRILEEHSWFCSSHINELMDFLIGLKSPVVITTVRSRFACLQILLVHTIEGSLDEENSKAFLVLNEIILTIKDSTEEARKAAYDLLIGIHSSLQRLSSATSDEPYQKLINMIMGYLSGSSPHIKSGAVSALSVLAVLGFVKVLVSSHQANDLQNFLPDVINGVLSCTGHNYSGDHDAIAMAKQVPRKPALLIKNRKRQRKRKHSEFSTPSEDGGKMEPRERMWEKKHKGFIPSKNGRMRPVKEDGNSYHDRKGQSQGSARNKTRNFKRRHTESRNTQAKQTKSCKPLEPQVPIRSLKFGGSNLARHQNDIMLICIISSREEDEHLDQHQ